MYNQFNNQGYYPQNTYDQRYVNDNQQFRFPEWDTFDSEERWEIARSLVEDGYMVDQNGYIYETQNSDTEEVRGDMRCRRRCDAKFSTAMVLCAKFAPGLAKVACINAANEARKRCRNRCRRED